MSELVGMVEVTIPILLKTRVMASGRVGGTKSLISGQVGKEVYQIVKQPDGTYTQVIISKGVRTETTTSERLQAQRMCTSMVESLMRDLKKVATISMQSAANKSKSLNAFSAYNLRLVANDCKANWEENNQFVYPVHTGSPTMKSRDLGGPFLLSAGTGQWNHFDAVLELNTPQQYIQNWVSAHHIFDGVQLNIPQGAVTVGDFLRRRMISRLDIIPICMFWSWTDESDPEDPVEDWKHSYCFVRINPQVPDNMPLTLDVARNLFLLESDRRNPNVWLSNSGQSFYIGFAMDDREIDGVWYLGAFTICYWSGKKTVTNSTYRYVGAGHGPYLLNAAPADVFWSWMDSYPHRWPNIFL